jgi:hypothetical protein
MIIIIKKKIFLVKKHPYFIILNMVNKINYGCFLNYKNYSSINRKNSYSISIRVVRDNNEKIFCKRKFTYYC